MSTEDARPMCASRSDSSIVSWLPTDVQNGIGSPAFGSFYDSEYRQFRMQVEFEG